MDPSYGWFVVLYTTMSILWMDTEGETKIWVLLPHLLYLILGRKVLWVAKYNHSTI